jgi:hypothetical protein
VRVSGLPRSLCVLDRARGVYCSRFVVTRRSRRGAGYGPTRRVRAVCSKAAQAEALLRRRLVPWHADGTDADIRGCLPSSGTPAAPADFDPHLTLEVFLNETASGAVPGNRLFRHFPVAETLGVYLEDIVNRIDRHFTPLFPVEELLAQTIPSGPSPGRHSRRVEARRDESIEGPGLRIPAGWGPPPP